MDRLQEPANQIQSGMGRSQDVHVRFKFLFDKCFQTKIIFFSNNIYLQLANYRGLSIQDCHISFDMHIYVAVILCVCVCAYVHTRVRAFVRIKRVILTRIHIV